MVLRIFPTAAQLLSGGAGTKTWVFFKHTKIQSFLPLPQSGFSREKAIGYVYRGTDLFWIIHSYNCTAGTSAICRAGQQIETQVREGAASRMETQAGFQCYSLEAGFLLLWKSSVFAHKDSADWMRRTYIMEGKQLSSTSNDCFVNVNHICKIPS